ncbi:MAG TPA: malectin domain-containing carbohydrate-binding protein [Kofleriaceae bacterium]|nr:malectin domain-containing carbohydrate-binding protein [Kofleriaceae bacterium]
MITSRHVLGLLVATGGCLPQPAFHCGQDSDCATAGAVCQTAVGYCSFSDLGCPSGQRFGSLSGSYANQCVGAANDGGVDSGRDARSGDGPAASFAARVNVAGPMYAGVDHPGTWAADPGAGGICDGTEFDSPTPTVNASNDSTLYVNQMFGSTLTCTIHGVPAGTYQVTLLFAELRLGGSPCVAAGDRTFDIQLEGTTVLSGFDLTTIGGGCAAAGGSGHPVDKTFMVTVNDGALDLVETASSGAAVLNAIEIVGQ